MKKFICPNCQQGMQSSFGDGVEKQICPACKIAIEQSKYRTRYIIPEELKKPTSFQMMKIRLINESFHTDFAPVLFVQAERIINEYYPQISNQGRGNEFSFSQSNDRQMEL